MFPAAILNFLPVPGYHLAASIFDVGLKSFEVLIVAGGSCLLARRASAATRHLVWFLALAVLPLLPWLPGTLPNWRRPLWTVSAPIDSGNQIAFTLELGPAAAAGVAPAPLHGSRESKVNPDVSRRPRPGPRLAAQFNRNWMAPMMALWIVGISLSLGWAALGRIQLWRLCRKTMAVSDPGLRRLLDEASRSLGLRRKVRLLRSAGQMMPLTWGGWRPVVLLPIEAEGWTAERQRIVLLHELAHVKRWDCLTQSSARIICALFWCNPLAWVAAWRMRVERERACDDLVLIGGYKASDYANHLVEIARSFRHIPQGSAIAMARSSGLEQRIAAMVDASRARCSSPMVMAAVATGLIVVVLGIGGCRTSVVNGSPAESKSLRERQIAGLEAFAVAKEKQSEILAAAAGEEISPLFKGFFEAATKGEWQTVTNMYESFRQNHPQYSQGPRKADLRLRTSYWQPVLEICLAYDQVVNGDPHYTQMAIEGIVDSIPAGSIYFGGTDPGRGLPTAFCKSHVDADPFYTLTQNALADGTYLEYLQRTYGEHSRLLDAFIKLRRSDAELQALDPQMREAMQTLASVDNGNPDDAGLKAAGEAVSNLRRRIDDRTAGIWAGLENHSAPETTGLGKQTIYTPTFGDSQTCFEEYLKDARRRLHEHQLKPGEQVVETPGRVEVSGQVAVMSINALMTKIIFDKNPDHEFYIEESFPLDWMYPYLEPHGLIMKIDRRPRADLPEDVVRRDREYWGGRVNAMIGDWLKPETPVSTVADFVEKVYLRKDLAGFEGDPQFVQNEYASRSFSHWRASLAGLYAWRAAHAAAGLEEARMAREADFAFRQAWALCPNSPDVVQRYTDFLKSRNRPDDASRVANSAAKFPPITQSTSKESPGREAGTAKPSTFEMRPVVDAERMTLVHSNAVSGQVELEPIFVQKNVLLDGTVVQSAKVSKDSQGHVQIDVLFTDAGREKFAEISRRNIHKRLAIIVDGRPLSAPVIKTEISGGRAVISGNFSDQEAQALADKINAAVAR